MSGKSANASPSGDSALPRMPRNRRVKCTGRSLLRYKEDVRFKGEIIHRKGDPILDDDHARQYRPCEAWAANGTDLCGNHGGSAPQTINAAKRTLALSANDVAAVLAQIAKDERVDAATRVKAVAQVLDRIGIRTGVDLGIETPKWQGLLAGMFGSQDAAADEEPGIEVTADVVAEVDVEPPRKARKASAKRSGGGSFEGW